MASRGTIKQWVRSFLGTTADDPFFADVTLDPIVQQAIDALVASIHEAAPHFLAKNAVLAASSSTSHNYLFASQATPVTDFAGWLEVRYDDQDGLELRECRAEELNNANTDYFAVIGPDESAVIETSKSSPTNKPLYLRYRYWPTDLAADTEVPGGVPIKFHDVIALEATFAFGLGGEQRLPPELHQRWIDRRAQLLSHCAVRGAQPQRTRLHDTEEYEG